VTARLAAHPEVEARAPEIRDRLVAAGVDVELVATMGDPVSGVLGDGPDLALAGAQGLRGVGAEGLTTLAVFRRQDPRDVLVGRRAGGPTLLTLPSGARVGVAGPRRGSFLKVHRPDLVPVQLADSRLLPTALESGDVEAGILGAIEARALGLTRNLREVLDPKAWLPAPGQGLVALVSRYPIAEATSLDHLPSRVELRAELALLDALDATPDAALGSLAQASGRWIRLWATLASHDGVRLVRSDLTAPLDEAELLGSSVAKQLMARGADIVLAGRTT
jgi:hydroxymethylbilane synthase